MNKQLFFECLEHPEPLIDLSYCREELVISEQSGDPDTDIMVVWAAVRDRITALSVAMADGSPPSTIHGHLEKLDALLLNSRFANYLEFTSFFPALDVSYSSYRKLADGERLEFLERVSVEYISKRHATYQSHGYTPVTIQVRRDFEKHKTGGSAAKRKVSEMLRAAEYTQAYSLEEFKAGPAFVHAEGVLYERCEAWLREHGLSFSWRASHQNKLPDLLVNASKRVLVVECKHVKEAGGGQDKQVAELIALVGAIEKSYVREDASSLSYVAFLDGVYFNELRAPRAKKIRQQREDILSALERCPNNFFVNTWGFNQLLRAGLV